MANLKNRVDEYQRRHRWAGFVFAVMVKFGEDSSGNLAVLLAYYAFLSIFPLLLALVTILGYVLAGHPQLEHEVFDSAIGQFPIIGQHGPMRALTGNPAALVIGLLLTIWSGLSVAQTGQTAINAVYLVPPTQRPGFLPRVLRSAELVGVGGLGLIVTTLVQGVVSGSGSYGLPSGLGTQAAGAVISVAGNVALFVYLYRRLTVVELTAKAVLPGSIVAGVVWFVLQKVGTSLVNTKVQGAESTYGTFAIVIGLLFWFYLLAQVVLLCAEINVVAERRLWPRGLTAMLGSRAATVADCRAYAGYAQREHHAFNVDVETRLQLEEEAG
jgi:YihY family inner membrane protein